MSGSLAGVLLLSILQNLITSWEPRILRAAGGEWFLLIVVVGCKRT